MEFAYDDDLYDVLGVEPEADDATIRKAYKKLAVTLHPDKWVDKPAEQRDDAQSRFAKVSYAYNVLKDAEQRNEYDFMRRMNTPDPDGPVLAPEAPTLTPQEQAERRERAEKRFRQGIAYQMEKNTKAALDSFKEAVRIDPTVAQYHTMLAATYQRMGWVSYAMAEIQAALKIEPKEPLALKIRNQLREMEKALAAEEEAKQSKGKKKKKKGEVVETKTRRKAATGQVSFKKKRTPFLQMILGSLFGRK